MENNKDKEIMHDIETGLLTNNKNVEHSPDDCHNYDSLRKRFWVQVIMTGAMTAFCITMLSINNDKRNNKEGVYLPVLTGLIGYWLPAPDARVKRPVSPSSK